ncbi:uncharacterized protein LOC128228213 isoform X1 [Mya arenaria]|uniref:uncharacterized protein LOC128228213 isoform X1 n=1 Tax=Mya arenaria TaxID=6604 RepID=UPI0022E8DAA0|nr:uncharacterized protein LOC128228213 isoform X1 [Mya arenaria]
MYYRWLDYRGNFDVGNNIFVVIWISLIMDLCAESARSYRQTIPKFVKTPNNVTVHRGELAELMCHIKDLGPRTVVWRKASEENPLTIGLNTFTPSAAVSVSHDELSNSTSKYNLMIKDVQTKHAGVYECQISASGIYTHYVALNVLSTPARRKPKVQVSGTEYVSQYNDIHLVCNATGVERAPEEIDWFFNGNKILTSHPHWYGRIEIVKHKPEPGLSFISELIINLSSMQDNGNYVCRSSDLSVDSLTVHVLNAGKNTGIVVRAPGEEKGSMRTAETTGTNKASTHSNFLFLTILCICSLTIF